MSIDRLGTKSGYHGWRGGLTLEFMRMTAHSSPEPSDPVRRWRNFMSDPAGVRHLFIIRYDDPSVPRPLPRADNDPARLEWAWSNYLGQLARRSWLADDSLPYLNCMGGTEIFAQAFGCPVHYPENNMPFALPLIHRAADVSQIKVPTLDAPVLARQFKFADELVRRAGPQALVRTVDVQSPMDIAALIWDKNDFYLALIDAPDAVRELSCKVMQLLTAFLDEWFSRYGQQHVAHYPDYLMPQGLTLSEDEIGVVSPELFVDLFLPELITLSQHFGGIGIHCCADSRHQWDNLLKIPALRLLNLNRPPDQRNQAYQHFAAYTRQWHGASTMADVEWLIAHVPTARAVLEVEAHSREEACQILENLQAMAADPPNAAAIAGGQ